jgi:hypothetical protein
MQSRNGSQQLGLKGRGAEASPGGQGEHHSRVVTEEKDGAGSTPSQELSAEQETLHLRDQTVPRTDPEAPFSQAGAATQGPGRAP